MIKQIFYLCTGELSCYPKQKVNLNAFVGAGFALNDRNFLYGNGQSSFQIVNVGLRASKDVKITEHYTLPVL